MGDGNEGEKTPLLGSNAGSVSGNLNEVAGIYKINKCQYLYPQLWFSVYVMSL